MVGADGAGGAVRQASASAFGTSVASGVTRYLWMRARARLDPGFSFISTEHGAFVAHVYPYSERHSALVVESRPECLASAGLLHADRAAAERILRRVFSDHLELDGLRAVTFPWQSFRTVRNRSWHAGNRVLIGDAAHTAHFSVGSGTRLAIEDAVVLAAELDACPDVEPSSGSRIGSGPWWPSCKTTAAAARCGSPTWTGTCACRQISWPSRCGPAAR